MSASASSVDATTSTSTNSATPQLGAAFIEDHGAKTRKKHEKPFTWTKEQRVWVRSQGETYLTVAKDKRDAWSKQKAEELVQKWTFAVAGDARQCFRRSLWNLAGRSQKRKEHPEVMKFPRKRCRNGADLWANVDDNKQLIDNAVASERGDKPTQATLGIRASVKAHMFKELPAAIQQEWNSKAASQNEVVSETVESTISRNQELLPDTLLATFEGSIGTGKNQVGDATYHCQVAVLREDGSIHCTSITCGFMPNGKTFKEYDPQAYAQSHTAFSKYAQEALIRKSIGHSLF
ncbi:hypothetical protein FPV67DRAFT_1421582 [Lyophyllum atratum]|nr:hypothetical protein FPV67DRAFT_1421582 [Lyophyllum atratum]